MIPAAQGARSTDRPADRRTGSTIALIVASIACGAGTAHAGDTNLPESGNLSASGGTFVFTRVNVLPMDTERVLRDRTVVVRNGTIVSIAEDAAAAPAPAIRIDGAGRFLMPGLADMHVHIGWPAWQQHGTEGAAAAPGQQPQAVRDELLLFVANGVTTVRNMSGGPQHLRLAQDVESGAVAGPHILNASPIIDGSPPAWPAAISVTEPGEARRLVRELAAAGYDFLKVYHNLTPEVYSAIADEARSLKLPVVGHVPLRVGLKAALESRQYSIEHLRGYDMAPGAPIPTDIVGRFSGFLSVTDAFIEDAVGATVAAGTWNCPTLALQMDGAVPADVRRGLLERPEMQLLPPSLRQSMLDDPFYVRMPGEVLDAIAKSVPVEFRVLRSLAAHGAPLIAGTDSPLLMTVPGFALHRELAVMSSAGLRPFAVLRAATADAARFLGRESTSGIVAPRMRADLLLLEHDPLLDIAHTRQIAGVMTQGRWLDRAALDGLLQDLQDRNGESPQERQLSGQSFRRESDSRGNQRQ